MSARQTDQMMGSVTSSQNLPDRGRRQATICETLYGQINFLHSSGHSFHIKKFCNRRFLNRVQFYLKNCRFAFLSHPLGELGVTHGLHIKTHGQYVLVITKLLALADMA